MLTAVLILCGDGNSSGSFTMTVYVARDNSGDLFMYQCPPEFTDGAYYAEEGDCWALDEELYPEVGNGECLEYTLTLVHPVPII